MDIIINRALIFRTAEICIARFNGQNSAYIEPFQIINDSIINDFNNYKYNIKKNSRSYIFS